MRIRELKNKTIKASMIHKKAYKVISVAVIIATLPLYALGWLLQAIQQFADKYCNVYLSIVSAIRDTIVKLIYFKECGDDE